MKLRFILLAYTLLMAGFLLFMGRGLSGGSERGRDMVFYNQQQKQVEEALGSNETEGISVIGMGVSFCSLRTLIISSSFAGWCRSGP